MKLKLLTAALAAVAALAIAAPVAGAAEVPKAGYTQFTGCPGPNESEITEICVSSTIESGHFQMGSKTVPITKPIGLTAGTNANFEGYEITAGGGLEAVPQEIPGGVIGITGLDWLINFLNAEALKLYAVTELAGTPNLNPQQLEVPIKARLVNPVLGPKCYVGSEANPIDLKLTYGTTNPPPPNEPITGSEPQAEFLENGIIRLKDGTYVDNSFAAPGATGCTLTLLGFLPVSLDGLVNFQAGLPSPAGTNETVQNLEIEAVEQLVAF